MASLSQNAEERSSQESGATDEDEWDDITHCVQRVRNGKMMLDVAGGGSHAWSYVLKWNPETNQTDVYTWSMPFADGGEVLQANKQLLCRHYRRCTWVKLSKGNIRKRRWRRRRQNARWAL